MVLTETHVEMEMEATTYLRDVTTCWIYFQKSFMKKSHLNLLFLNISWCFTVCHKQSRAGSETERFRQSCTQIRPRITIRLPQKHYMTRWKAVYWNFFWKQHFVSYRIVTCIVNCAKAAIYIHRPLKSLLHSRWQVFKSYELIRFRIPSDFIWNMWEQVSKSQI